jgi:hypothetical protein
MENLRCGFSWKNKCFRGLAAPSGLSGGDLKSENAGGGWR